MFTASLFVGPEAQARLPLSDPRGRHAAALLVSLQLLSGKSREHPDMYANMRALMIPGCFNKRDSVPEFL